jgi:hypothetical protein
LGLDVGVLDSRDGTRDSRSWDEGNEGDDEGREDGRERGKRLGVDVDVVEKSF